LSNRSRLDFTKRRVQSSVDEAIENQMARSPLSITAPHRAKHWLRSLVRTDVANGIRAFGQTVEQDDASGASAATPRRGLQAAVPTIDGRSRARMHRISVLVDTKRSWAT
jgi:hypothetical protein